MIDWIDGSSASGVFERYLRNWVQALAPSIAWRASHCGVYRRAGKRSADAMGRGGGGGGWGAGQTLDFSSPWEERGVVSGVGVVG
jgi:hypothetical protein